MNDESDHTANSLNGHDKRAEGDAFEDTLRVPVDAYQKQVERREALDTIRRHVSRIRDTVQLDLVDALDRLVMMLDVGGPPERDAPRPKWIRWDGPVSLAEERTNTTRRRIAQAMRDLADDLDPDTDASVNNSTS